MWYEPGGPNMLTTVTVPMAQDIYVGLPVTSHDDAALATAAFSQLFITP